MNNTFTHALTKKFYLFCLIPLFAVVQVFGQAPIISYQAATYNFALNKAVTPFAPTNVGGAVPATVFGQVSTLAGQFASGSVDGTGPLASFNSPTGVTTDVHGNVYVADQSNNTIRKISAGGVVTTLAGGFSGPTSVATDRLGNVYVADEWHNQIGVISPAGVVITLAGSGLEGSNNGIGTAASFKDPTGVATDVIGNVYVADQQNNLIRMISPAGVVTTLAGNGQYGQTNGIGTAASFNNPNGLAVDALGNIYVADQGNNLIRKISPAGVVSTLAGTGALGSTDGPASVATFYYPSAVAVDATGNIYVADLVDNKIRMINPFGIVSTLAGTGLPGSADGTGAMASFNRPSGIATDVSGNVYVADQQNNLIRKIIATGYSISPALPAGLSFDGTTGIISGTPTAASPVVTYTVTAYNLSGSNTTSLNLAVNSQSPVMTTTGTLPALTTFLGSASSTDSIFVSGSNLVAGTVVNAPAGFEVSADKLTYSIKDSLTTIGALASTPIYIRLAAADTVGNYAGNVIVTSTGAVNDMIAIASSTVLPKPLITTLASVPALTSYQGKTSSIDSFLVAGTHLVAKIALKAPAGFSLSNDKLTFSSVDTLGGSATLAPTKVYFRLDTNVTIGLKTGKIVLSTTQAVNDSVSISCNILPGHPYIYSFNPNHVPAGSQVTLKGINFNGTTSFNIAGIAAESFKIVSDTVLTAIVGSIQSGNIIAINQFGPDTLAGFLGNHIPHVTYPSPNVDTVNIASIPLNPANDGGAVGSDHPGLVTTFAGTGYAALIDGTGTNAVFNGTFGITTDTTGVVYVADTYNNAIRKITSDGVVTTLAGNGTPGFTNGVGGAATFSRPIGIATDFQRNVYVADQNNNVIRKITPSGVVTTFAGSGTAGSADGIGTAASFNGPYGVALDTLGNVFVTDHGNQLIRKITPAGVVSTLAGSGAVGADNGQGAAATFHGPSGITLDPSGNIYVSDESNNLIRKITQAGLVSTFAGSGAVGNADGTGTNASFGYPCGLGSDAQGNIYLADGWNNNVIRKITPAGVVTTIAGNGNPTTVNGVGTAASFRNPYGVTVDPSGTIYVAETGGYVIRKIESYQKYVIKPLVSPGLNFDYNTGIFSGTPTAVNPLTKYAVWSYNSSGHNKTTVSITVAPSTPKPTIVENGTLAALNAAVTNPSVADKFTISGTLLSAGITVTPPAGFEVSRDSATFTPTLLIGTGGTLPTTPVYIRLSAADAVGSYSGQVKLTTPGASTDSVTMVSSTVTLTPVLPPPPPPPLTPLITYAGSPVVDTVGVSATPLMPANTGGAVGSGIPYGVSTLAGVGYPGNTNGVDSVALFNGPYGTAVDTAGNVYVTDTYNNLIRKISPAGFVTTLAGSGAAGSANGTGAAASFNHPVGIATDIAGNVYVADQANNLIRKISPLGVVTTLAGNGLAGSANGTGVAASFSAPFGLALDASGNVFVSDHDNNLIREITPAGIVTTVAGSGTYGAVNGASLTSTFNGPTGIAVDGSNNVYVADQNNNLIRKISGGSVSTLAGSGAYGNADGTGAAASFGYPAGLTVDAAGNVFLADGWSNNVIRKITPAGVVTTVAGSGTAASTNGIGTAAAFRYPYGISADAAGNLYVAETGGYRIRKISTSVAYSVSPALSAGLLFDSSTGIISGTPTVANPITNYTVTAYNNNGHTSTSVSITVVPGAPVPTIATTGTLAALTTAAGTPSAGSKFFASGTTLNAGIVVTPPAGFELSTDSATYHTTIIIGAGGNIPSTPIYIRLKGADIAGTYSGEVKLTSVGAAADSILMTVCTVTVAPIVIPAPPAPPIVSPPVFSYSGAVVDTAGIISTPIAPGSSGGPVGSASAGTVTTLAGTGYAGLINGNGAAAVFNGPYGIAVDTAGYAYVSDTYNSVIRKIAPNGDVSTLAGSGSPGSADGTGLAASFSHPVGVAVDLLGNVYVADQGNNMIRKISKTGLVTTLAGSTSAGSADGSGASAGFNAPYGVAVDISGNVFVTDQLNNTIRKITPGGMVTTIAGSGVQGYADGSALTAMFNQPSGIVLNAAGDIFIADQKNNRIRKLSGGVVSTLAGNSHYGSADGADTSATFGYPCGITIDIAGNIYVADGWSNNVIRQVSSSGYVTTIAGNGTPGSSNGQGSTATFRYPYGVSIDKYGNLYVAETGGYLIRKISSSVAYSISPALSPGLTFSAQTGTISGIPTAPNPLTTYTVTAFNTGGHSSSTVTITVVSPITFAAIPAKTYGCTDFSAGAVSKYPVTYTSSDQSVATIVAGKVHIIRAGTTVISATTLGVTLTQTLTVNNAPLFLTAIRQTKVAGTANPYLTFNYTGFVNNDNAGYFTSPAVISTTATLTSPVGKYPITVTGGSIANYNLIYIPDTLCVTAAPLPGTATPANSPDPVVNTGVSPNGDGINDVLTINNIVDYPSNKLTLINLSGNIVFTQKNYDNVTGNFDGHANVGGTALLPAGTYLYILDYTDNGLIKQLTGYIILKYH